MSAVIVTSEFIDREGPPITRALLRRIVSHADRVGEDRHGRTILRFELAAEPWLLDRLASLGAGDEDREDTDRDAEDDVE